jgi:hypothetical protein
MKEWLRTRLGFHHRPFFGGPDMLATGYADPEDDCHWGPLDDAELERSRLRRRWSELRQAQACTLLAFLLAFGVFVWTLDRFLPQPIPAGEWYALTGERR